MVSLGTERVMRRRDAIALIGSAALFSGRAFGQQTNKVPRIGWIILGSPAGTHPDIFSYYDSFRAGLSDLGYVEGANLTISAKDAEGVPERLPKLIDELVAENVSALVLPKAEDYPSRSSHERALDGGQQPHEAFVCAFVVRTRLQYLKHVLGARRQQAGVANLFAGAGGAVLAGAYPHVAIRSM